jgi:hypothetical protein
VNSLQDALETEVVLYTERKGKPNGQKQPIRHAPADTEVRQLLVSRSATV